MGRTYSVSEAKAKLSEVIRQVRGGSTVTVSHRGKPVAEIRAIDSPPKSRIEQRLEELERRGALVRSKVPWRPFAVARRPGALARFLAERGE